MTRALRALDAFWFVPATPVPLAVLRIILGVAALVDIVPRFRRFVDIAGSSPSVFEPVGLARLLDAPIPQQLFTALLAATLIANVAFLLGWRFAFTGPLFAGLLLWVLTYRNSWSMIYHTDNLMVLHVIVLGLTRSADALSLDARRRSRQARTVGGAFGGEPPIETPHDRHWEYGYPIRLLCAITVITYVLAGIAKVAGPMGWGWATGESMRTQIAFDGLRKEFLESGAQPLGIFVWSSPPLSAALAVGSLVIELGAPLALLHPRLGLLWVLGTFAMHWGIYAVMGITFWYHQLGFAFASFLVDERLVGRVSRWRAALVKRASTPVAADDADLSGVPRTHDSRVLDPG